MGLGCGLGRWGEETSMIAAVREWEGREVKEGASVWVSVDKETDAGEDIGPHG